MTRVQYQQVYTPQNFSLDAFAKHADQYLTRKEQRPWCETSSAEAVDGIARIIHFTFDDRMFHELVRRPRDFERDLIDAILYGFVGRTNGGTNGIVSLRPQDQRMQQRVRNYAAAHAKLLARTYGIRTMKGVKIVVHRPSGERIIGIRDPNTNNAVFIGRMAYRA